MILNKFDKIQFILNGKQETYTIKFGKYMYDVIPIYYSKDINKYKVIKFNDGSILVIINECYKVNTDKTLINIGIIHSILKIEYEKYDDTIIDLHLAHWFGFTSTINYIKSLDNMDTNIKNKRVSMLENILLNNNNINIHEINLILNNIKFININELECNNT